MGDREAMLESARGNHPVFALMRNRTIDKAISTVTLMVLGCYAGRSLSHLVSAAAEVDMGLAIFGTGLGAVLATYLGRLAIFDPSNSLIVKISAEGITLGYPANLHLAWTEVDQVKLVRPTYGSLPVCYLQVIRTTQPDLSLASREIIHPLGVVWDRRSKELGDALSAFSPPTETPPNGDPTSYHSDSWTGLR